MPGVDLPHAFRVRRCAGRKCDADVAHKGESGLWRRPDPQHPGVLGGWIAEAVPVTAGGHKHRARRCLLRRIITGHQQLSAEHVNSFIEFVMRVRNRTGEVARDGEFHRGETWRQPVLASQDVHRLAGIGERRSITWAHQQGHDQFLPSVPARTRGYCGRGADLAASPAIRGNSRNARSCRESIPFRWRPMVQDTRGRVWRDNGSAGRQVSTEALDADGIGLGPFICRGRCERSTRGLL
jgi:hypothetical protein